MWQENGRGVEIESEDTREAENSWRIAKITGEVGVQTYFTRKVV